MANLGSNLTAVSKEAVSMVEDIFQQGDVRYDDHYSTQMVAYFIENGGISIKKAAIPNLQPEKNELQGIRSPQQSHKFAGKKYLEEHGYKVVGFEVPIPGGRVDILAVNPASKERIAIECCSCRTDKAIEYLRNGATVLWIISLSENGFLDRELPLFIISRGPNWNECIARYDRELRERAKSVKSLLV